MSGRERRVVPIHPGPMRYLWLLCAALLALAGPLQGQPQGPSAGMKKVHLAIPVLGVSQMPAVVAKELGYYRQEGFDPQISVMKAGLTIQALVAGSIDYTGTPGGTIAAAVQGVKVVVLVAYSNKPLYDLVARPEVSSYGQLKGKVFGVGSLTGFSFEIPRVMLSRNGVHPERDVTMIMIGSTADRLLALKANSIQATVLDPPYNFVALKEGFRKLDFSGDYYQSLFGALTTTDRKIKTDQEAVGRFVKATLQGFLSYRDQRQVVLPIVQRFLKLTDQQLAQQIYDYHRATLTADGTVSEALMRTIIETQRQSAGVTRTVTPEEVFNFTFVRAAMGDLKRP